MPIMIAVSPKAAERLRAKLERMIEIAQRDIEKFQHDFAQNPAFAMRWANTAFRAAAEQEVAYRCINLMECGATADDVAKHLHSEIVRGARPSHSTSQTSNLVDEELLIAATTLFEDITFPE